MSYDSAGLSDEELERLERVCDDLALLSISGVPAVAAGPGWRWLTLPADSAVNISATTCPRRGSFRRDTRPSVYSPELKRELDRPRDLRHMGPSEAPSSRDPLDQLARRRSSR